MRTLLLYTLLYLGVLMAATPAMAQKTCVIADAETHVPIRDALVHTDNGVWARTDYRGYFTIKYPFDSAEVSKKGYVSTTIYLENLPDSVFLLPEAQQLTTVEVWGKANESINHMADQIQEEVAEQPRAVTGIGFDLGGLFDQRARRDRKHLKKAKELMRQMDGQGDPVIEEYEQATGRKYVEGGDSLAPVAEAPDGEHIRPVSPDTVSVPPADFDNADELPLNPAGSGKPVSPSTEKSVPAVPLEGALPSVPKDEEPAMVGERGVDLR